MSPAGALAKLQCRKRRSLRQSAHRVLGRYEAKRARALRKGKHKRAASLALTIENVKRMANELE